MCRNADHPLGHTRGYGKVWLPENTAESPMVTAVKMLDSTTTDSALLNSHTHAPINRTQTTMHGFPAALHQGASHQDARHSRRLCHAMPPGKSIARPSMQQRDGH